MITLIIIIISIMAVLRPIIEDAWPFIVGGILLLFFVGGIYDMVRGDKNG